MTSPTTQDTVNQQEVFDFLADPATHADADVSRIDTHAAVVFLAGDRALKVKRPIRFPFLDYSTLAKRKASCDEEIRINRPSAPQIYRRVVAITQGHDGSLSIDGDGRPVEYAVEMTRFDERLTLDHLAQAGQLQVGQRDLRRRLGKLLPTRARRRENVAGIDLLGAIGAHQEDAAQLRLHHDALEEPQ